MRIKEEQQTIWGMIESARKVYPTDHFWRTYFTAGRILGALLGLPWLERHVMGLTAPTDYFRNGCDTQEEQDLHSYRVVSLAEILMNLQHVPGFSSVLKLMRERNPEAVVAEFQSGELLFRSGVEFRFLEPEPGKTYDIDITTNGVVVAAESKCKLEENDVSVASLKGTFNKARGQFPKGQPGVILAKVSQPFGDDHAANFALFEAGIDAFYKQGTNRVACIYIYQQTTKRFAGQVGGLYALMAYPNPRQPFAELGIDWREMLDVEKPAQWRSLAQMCA